MIQFLIYGFACLSAFTLITIGAWQGNEWMVGSGTTLIGTVFGYYLGDKKVVETIKSKFK